VSRFVLRYVVADLKLPPGRTWLFGRGAECDVRLDDPAASRQHARLEVGSDEVWLADLGSRNGSSVNGERLVGRRRLQAGDWFRVGRTEFSLERDEGADAPGAGTAAPAHAVHGDTRRRVTLVEIDPSGATPAPESDFEGDGHTRVEPSAHPSALALAAGQRWLHDQTASPADRLGSALQMVELLGRMGSLGEAEALMDEALDVIAPLVRGPLPPATVVRARELVTTWLRGGAADGGWTERLAMLDVERGSFEDAPATAASQVGSAAEIELRRAIDAGEVRAHFQPIAELSSGRISGFEALARWEHPARGLVPPAKFIPLAEESGLIVAIGERMLRDSCEALALWRARHGSLGVSVNVSSHQFQQPDLVAQVERALADSALAPDALTLELTESAIMKDARSAAHMLLRLRAVGVRISVDDFGTGYSSLSYLQQFALSALKVDRSFVVNLGRDREDVAIVRTIITLAHALKLVAVAEGIETDAQLARLRSLRCDFGQGYLFARPLPVAQIDALLASQPQW